MESIRESRDKSRDKSHLESFVLNPYTKSWCCFAFHVTRLRLFTFVHC